MMGLPNVRSCCGCFSIEVGAKIIAWIQLTIGGLLFAYFIESVVEVLLSKHINRSFVYIHTTVKLVFCSYPIVQGTILFIGIKKKRASILLIWLILAFIFEIFVSSLALLYSSTIFFTIFDEHLLAAAIIYIGGIQTGVSFFFIVIVSTCRKNILRRNARFDYGVLYTPDAVEILTPKQRKGLIPTNPQFDYAALDTPEDKPEDDM